MKIEFKKTFNVVDASEKYYINPVLSQIEIDQNKVIIDLSSTKK